MIVQFHTLLMIFYRSYTYIGIEVGHLVLVDVDRQAQDVRDRQ